MTREKRVTALGLSSTLRKYHEGVLELLSSAGLSERVIVDSLKYEMACRYQVPEKIAQDALRICYRFYVERNKSA